MQIVNHFRAAVFNSSYAALKLASEDSEYIPFARKIISAKSTNVHRLLAMSVENQSELSHVKKKIRQYDSFLCRLDRLEAKSRNTFFYSIYPHDFRKHMARP